MKTTPAAHPLVEALVEGGHLQALYAKAPVPEASRRWSRKKGASSVSGSVEVSVIYRIITEDHRLAWSAEVERLKAERRQPPIQRLGVADAERADAADVHHLEPENGQIGDDVVGGEGGVEEGGEDGRIDQAVQKESGHQDRRDEAAVQRLGEDHQAAVLAAVEGQRGVEAVYYYHSTRTA